MIEQMVLAGVENYTAGFEPARHPGLEARTAEEIERGFATSARDRAAAVIVAADAFFSGQGPVIGTLGVKHHLPTIGIYREHVVAGGLMSYGQNIA